MGDDQTQAQDTAQAQDTSASTTTATPDWHSDPEFHQLPLNEKNKVLMQVDKDYAALPAPERAKALNTIHYGPNGTKFEQERSDPNTHKSTIASVPGVPGEQAKGLWDSTTSAFTGPVKAYQTSRKRGEGVGKALTMGAGSLLYNAVPGAKTAYEAAQAPGEYQNRREHGYSPAYSAMAPAAASATNVNLPAMEHKADIGDTGGVAAEALVPAAETVLAAGAHEFAAGPGKRIVEARNARQGPANITKALNTPAGKKGATAAKMAEDVHTATADLAAIEKETPAKVTSLLKRGKGSESFRDLADKIDSRQDAMWEEGHKPAIQRQGSQPIDHRIPFAAARKVVTDMATRANGAEAKLAMDWLNEQNQPTTIGQADNLIREINADLKGKDANTRYGPLQVRVRRAYVDSLRNTMDTQLDNLGEKGVKPVNKRWGALENIKGRLQERAVQEAQKEAKTGPLPDWAHMYMFLHGGNILPTIGAGIRAGAAMKPAPGTQLTRGMRQLGSNVPLFTDPAPFTSNAPPAPHGLLPAPATELPGPGAAEIAHPEMFPAPTTSAEAPRQTYRDKPTGRMARGYKSDMPPAVVGQTAEGGPMHERIPTGFNNEMTAVGPELEGREARAQERKVDRNKAASKAIDREGGTGTERRSEEGKSPTGKERRYVEPQIGTKGKPGIKPQPSEGEKLAESIRQDTGKKGHQYVEGDAIRSLMSDPGKWKKFTEAFDKEGKIDRKAQAKMLSDELAEMKEKNKKAQNK
jgi:hypothetical protein